MWTGSQGLTLFSRDHYQENTLRVFLGLSHPGEDCVRLRVRTSSCRFWYLSKARALSAGRTPTPAPGTLISSQVNCTFGVGL